MTNEQTIRDLQAQIDSLQKTIDENSYTCNDCDQRRFGPPAGTRSESAEHGVELVCPACLAAMQGVNIQQLEGTK